MDHSRGGMIHSFSERFKTRKSSFVAASSLGKCPLARTARLSFAFKANRIRGVQNLPDIDGESVERDDSGPGASPALADCRVFLAPVALFEADQRGFAAVSIERAINLIEGSGN